MTVEVQCAECGTPFTAKTKRGKYCKTACRVKANRRPTKTGAAAAAAGEQPPPSAGQPPAPPAVGGLVSMVAADLGKIEALDTIPGRAALALAYRIESPMETGSAAAAMTRELSRLIAEARAEVAPKHRDAGDDVEDRVARKLRSVS